MVTKTNSRKTSTKRTATTSKKQTSAKRTATTSKKQFTIVAVARIPYGPFPTKKIAESVLAQVRQVPRTQISTIRKTTKGYTFSASVMYGLKSASQKATAFATIKKHAPSAKVSFKKV
jgi:hypothetical protein